MKLTEKTGIIIGFIISILIILNSCNTSHNDIIQTEIDSIVTRYLPDQREGICRITVKIGQDGKITLIGETTIPMARQEIVNTLSKPGIELIDSIITYPDPQSKEKQWGLVTISVINLRRLPQHSSELVSQAILGTPVLILKSEDSWVLIQTPDKYIAWTEKSSIESKSTDELDLWKKAEKIVFTGNSGYISTYPDKPGIVGDLTLGSILEKVGVSEGFAHVVLPDGREGYIDEKLIMDFESWRDNDNVTCDKIINTAVSFLGLPYLWGGSSSKAVDCSGFVQSVYFYNGIILSRDASLQHLHGRSVDFSNGFEQLEKGDLLFFGSKDNDDPHVSHVAIYMGENQYIHSSGRVMINSLDPNQINFNSYRRNSLLAVKRILGVKNDNGIVPVCDHPWY